MKFEIELNFFKKLLSQLHLNIHLIKESDEINTDIDLGLRKFLGFEEEYVTFYRSEMQRLLPNTLYQISDDFFCKYVAFELPDDTASEKLYVVIGPYMDETFSNEDIYRATQEHQLAPKYLEHFLRYYTNVTFLSDESHFTAILTAFADTIWGSNDKYSVRNLEKSFSSHHIDAIANSLTDTIEDQKDISFKMQLLEKRYNAENRFMQYIAQGNYHKAESALEGFRIFEFDNRSVESIRSIKHHCVVMNTILRKAAEQGAVHPIHIEKVSADFTKKIEKISTKEAGSQLLHEMVRKYGTLVKKYSLNGYSLLIQKVITRIDSDLTADQTLNAHSKLLNISPSYLSTLFRQETGVTLTEYVNRKRIEHGIYLLNTTNLQIQTIAQHCGIPDINYFTRVFKKYIGKTPKEYRNSISG